MAGNLWRWAQRRKSERIEMMTAMGMPFGSKNM
jgi:hypothetical protein